MPDDTLIERFHIEGQGPLGSWPLHVRFVLLAGLVIGWVLLGANVTFAHEGGEFGIDIPVERIAPGTDLPIVGSEWAPNSILEVELQPSGSSPTTIGAIRTDPDGHFDTAVRLPDELPAGTAVIQVRSDYGVLDSAVVTIDPAATPSALPSGSGAAAPANDALDPFPLLALATAVAALGFLAVKTRRRANAR